MGHGTHPVVRYSTPHAGDQVFISPAAGVHGHGCFWAMVVEATPALVNGAMYLKVVPVADIDGNPYAKSIEIAAPPSRVWPWFASQQALRRWLTPTLEIDLQVAGKYRMRGGDGETWISGQVLELVPEGKLILSWLEEDAGWAHPGRLVIELAAAAGGTRVTLTHDGFAGIGTPTWQRTADVYERGVAEHPVLEDLAAAVAAGDLPAAVPADA